LAIACRARKDVNRLGVTLNPDTPEARKALNRLAREKMKYRLLADISLDLVICELEGWSKTEYLNELKDMINELGGEKNGPDISRKNVSGK
jgi:hypothetical protein